MSEPPLTDQRCPTCGGRVPGHVAGRGFCPRCLLNGALTPRQASAERVNGCITTTWADSFPQFEVTRVLRETDEASAYLAKDLVRDGRAVVLQILSGCARGGARSSELTASAIRFREKTWPGIAPLAEAGDLAEAFYLVTEVPGPEAKLLTDSLNGSDAPEVLLDRAARRATRILDEARADGLEVSFDPSTAWVFSEMGEGDLEVVITPDVRQLATTSPRAEGAVPPATPLEAGEVVGGFVLEARLGEGGFGEVWRASQERPVRRTVALKVLKHGASSPRTLDRFEIEQQALARLDHPHIARFFEGGCTADRRPFFAMELIEGRSITRHCGEERLSLDQRLELFASTCHAVQHAHQKGILHRDLKPSNVMVTTVEGKPSVKVIDFGIARALEEPLLDRTMVTRAEEVVGTPATMSPEQAEGARGTDVDVRSDVYGLGVLLYELLTGQLPFDPDLPPDELRRQIREVDPRKPSTCLADRSTSRRLRGDLDWIVMRCLEKDPERRYATVEDLARDLERHAHDQPVEAGPPELVYRMRKFVRRNRVGLAVASVLAFTLVTATVVSLGSAKRARDAQGAADEALQDMRGAFGELDTATYQLIRTGDEQRIQTVHSLLEEGTDRFNRRDSSALFTLAEAVAAAKGDDRLMAKALEIWTTARAVMPGVVRSVHRIQSDHWTYLRRGDESFADHFLISAGPQGLRVEDLETGETTVAELDPRLASDDLRQATADSSDRVVLWSEKQAVFQVWSTNPAKPITNCIVLERIRVVALSPEGSRLAIRTEGGTLMLWAITDEGALVQQRSLKIPDTALAVSLSPSWRQMIVFGATDDPTSPPANYLGLFDLEIPSEVPVSTVELPGPAFAGGGVSFVDEDTVLATRFHDLHVWDHAKEKLHRRDGIHEVVEPLPGRSAVAAGMRDGRVLRLSLPSLTPEGDFQYHGAGGVTHLATLGDGEMLASVGRNGRLRVALLEEPGADPFEWPFAAPRTPNDGYVFEGRNSGELVSVLWGQLRIWDLDWRGDHPVGDLPSGATLMDVGRDGRLMLLRGAGRDVLQIVEGAEDYDPAAAEVIGERKIAEGKWIAGARFAPDLSGVFFNVRRGGVGSTERGEFYHWKHPEGSDDHFIQWTESGGAVLKEVLSTSPPLAVVSSLGWEFRLADLARGDSYRDVFVCRHGVDNRATCVIDTGKLGWYGLGSWSGRIRRFDLATHEELFPEITGNAPLQGGACSGDNQWALTQERGTPPDGRMYLRAWYLGGGPPFYGIRLPLGLPSDEALNPGEPDTYDIGKPFPVGERSFVYQVGDELRRVDLPQVSLAPERIARATQVALGGRRDEFGAFDNLTPEEYGRCVAELAQPIPSPAEPARSPSDDPQGSFHPGQFAEMMDWLSQRELRLGNEEEAREARALALIGTILDHPDQRTGPESGLGERYEAWCALDPNAVAAGREPEGNLLRKGAHWRYHACREGAVVPEGWQSAAFDDSGWPGGAAPLGYGDEVVVSEVASADNPAGNPRTVLFRRTFEAGTNPGIPVRAYLRADDGAAVYVNGEEVFRLRLPNGALDATVLASRTVSGSAEATYEPFSIPARFLRVGINVIAVEVHQINADSSDVIFDLAVEEVSARELRAIFANFDAEAALERIRGAYPLKIFGFPADWRERVEVRWSGHGDTAR